MTDQRLLVKSILDGFKPAKEGNAREVYSRIMEALGEGIPPEKAHYTLGWIIYYALHQSSEKDIIGRKLLLNQYLKLKTERPHKQHSMILLEAIRLYRDSIKTAFATRNESKKNSFSFIRFMSLWDFSNLRPGDWKRKEIEGHLTTSTAEKMITAYVDELWETNSTADKQFSDLVDYALSLFPDDFNLLSQRAELYRLEADPKAAREMLRKALLIAPNKPYLWQRLASTIENIPANLNLYIALLYKALCAPGPEQFKGRIHLSLASVLAARGKFGYAKWEVEWIKKIYTREKWHIPREVEIIEHSIPSDTVVLSPIKDYRKVEHLADNEVYSQLEETKVKKTYHRLPSAPDKFGRQPVVSWKVTDDKGNSIWFQPERMKIDPNLPIGTELLVRIYNNRIVKADLPPRGLRNYSPDTAQKVSVSGEPEPPSYSRLYPDDNMPVDELEELRQYSRL